MTRWSNMTALERAEVAARLTERMTYRAAAAQLGTTVGAIAGALHRAPTTRQNAGKPRSPQHKGAETKSLWTETRLTEPWARWSAKRKAERMAGAGSDAR